MFKDALKHNESAQPNTHEIDRLREHFPHYFDGDGNFLVGKFTSMLTQEEVDLSKEGYGLNFLGRSYAEYQTSLLTETALVPDLKHNNDKQNQGSQNLYLVGDNLEALKHLTNSYAGKVKCIYIDPPYNTGFDDFVYNDDFGFTVKELVEKVGLEEEEAQRVLELKGRSTHSAWLTFMYPRLKLAKELLSENGVIFVSIDDNEQANLKLLLDDIFGESNFVAGFVIVRSEGGGLAKQAVIGHDYLPTYCKSIDNFVPLGRPKEIRGKIIERDGKTFWIETDWLRKEFGKYGTCHYEEIEEYLGASKKAEIDQGLEDGNYILVEKKGFHLVGRLRDLDTDTSKFYTILKGFDGEGTAKYLNKDGVDDLKELGVDSLFDFPKPVKLVKDVVRGATITSKKQHDIILDFFSGSGTTAQAVMELNAEDGGNRQYIMVQLPQEVSEKHKAFQAGYRTIDEIGRERIRRASNMIREKTSADIDYGFKLYRLERPTAESLEQIHSFDPEQEALFQKDMVAAFQFNGTKGHDTILTTWLNLDDYGLTSVPATIPLDTYALDVCGDSAYLINPGITSEDVHELVRLIENDEIRVTRVVYYPYSVPFHVEQELKTNLNSAALKNNVSIKLIARY